MLGHQCIQFAATKTLRLSDKAVEAVLVIEMEFLSLLEGWLIDSNIVTMTSLQSTFMNIVSENGCESLDISRKKLKLKEIGGNPRCRVLWH